MLTTEIPAGLSDADVIAETVGPILGQNTDGIEAAIDAVAACEVDNTKLASERNCGFGEILDRTVTPRALSTRQTHSDGSHRPIFHVCRQAIK